MIKKVILFLCLILFISPTHVFAQLSCCSSQGGEKYCDYATSTLYCNDGTASTTCSCKAADTPTPTPTSIPLPTVIPSPSPTPVCPAFSAFDSVLKGCKCKDGYVVSDTSCITYQQYCWNKLGGNSTYDSGKNSCICTSGNTYNDAGTSCISFNQVCINKLGSKSYYNSDTAACMCFEGYAIQDNQCKLLPTPTPTKTPNASLITVTITSIPTPTSTPKPRVTPTPFPTPFTLLHVLPSENKDLGIKNYVTVKNETSENFLVTLIQNIVNFLRNLL